ncbi:fungal-specific transcription factor domain-containing protein [Phascolomyces articulosus]|uniref:Fungal-specific transcription factor domain-containing protein n=1 Tax=Phascolomyces articulosus TaxID=60185 RepID=A0AAD5K3E5_9FUNG|nr:fungal-specific transcription factor domain-containing protein [Phascolomyces articulosus]
MDNSGSQQQSSSTPQVNPASLNYKSKIMKPNAKRSCDHCRKKKVRCNSHLQQPCTTCQKSGTACIVSRPIRMSQIKKSHISTLEKRVNQLESILLGQNNHAGPISPSTTQGPPQQNTSASLTPIVQYMADQNSTANFTSPSPPLAQTQKSKKINFVYSLWMNDTPKQSDMQLQKQIPSSSSSSSNLTVSNIGRLLPTSPLSTSASRSFAQLLQTTLDMIQEIPDLTPELTEQLLESYFCFVYGRIPIVDRRSFLIQYYFQYPQPLEKHLLYAVCALGCQFRPRIRPTTDASSLERKIGQRLRKKALEVLHFAYERSSISTLQALLIMSMLSPNSVHGESSSTNWLILGAAIRMSQDLDLLREDHYPSLPKSEIELRRRLAYCVYMWDKYSAAATGKPYTVRDEDFYVKVPLIYEQEQQDSISINELLNEESSVPRLLKQAEEDIQKQRSVFYLHVNSVIPMSKMIGQILASLYTPKPGIDMGESIDSGVDVDLVANLDARLLQWRQAALDQRKKCSLKDAPFEMFYNGGILLLYRPLISDATFIQRATTNDGDLLLDICTTAAIEIVDYIDTSPVWGIPCLKDHMVTMCATVFLQNCNHMDGNIRLQARRNLRRCAELYKCDDIIGQCQNATVLDELSKQLMPQEQKSSQLPRFTGLGLPNEEQRHAPISPSPSTTPLESTDSSYTNIIAAWQKLQQEHQQVAQHDLRLMMDMDSDQPVLDLLNFTSTVAGSLSSSPAKWYSTNLIVLRTNAYCRALSVIPHFYVNYYNSQVSQMPRKELNLSLEEKRSLAKKLFATTDEMKNIKLREALSKSKEDTEFYRKAFASQQKTIDNLQARVNELERTYLQPLNTKKPSNQNFTTHTMYATSVAPAIEPMLKTSSPPLPVPTTTAVTETPLPKACLPIETKHAPVPEP